MKKKLIMIVCAVLSFVWLFSVVNVNIKAERIPEKIYPMNVWVEYGTDFYDKATENREGYWIKVTGVSVTEFDEYLDIHGIKIYRDEELFKPEYIYNVTVVIKNTDNTESGISMLDTTLSSVNNMMQIDYDVFDALYPQLNGSISFSVKPGTEMEFNFPFVVSNREFELKCNYNYFVQNTFKLNLSRYPVSKSIEVRV